MPMGRFANAAMTFNACSNTTRAKSAAHIDVISLAHFDFTKFAYGNGLLARRAKDQRVRAEFLLQCHFYRLIFRFWFNVIRGPMSFKPG